MKKIYILLAFVLLLVSVSYAMGSAPKSKLKGEDKKIGKALVSEYGVTQKQIDHLRQRGYTMTDVYYLTLLAKEGHKEVNTVAAMHAKGVGWGVLAKKLGVHPSDLNRLRSRLHNIKKKEIKVQKKGLKPIKVHAPKPVKMKPMKGGGGGKKN